ncbi:hypothetical protein, partial [Providencia rettgeri]|uniref:hypothetical protein n=1 Tax=Providencia rettgeri TaxID=587 RepID=UPI001B3676BC
GRRVGGKCGKERRGWRGGLFVWERRRRKKRGREGEGERRGGEEKEIRVMINNKFYDEELN